MPAAIVVGAEGCAFMALDRDDPRRSGFERYIFALYIVELSDADTYASRNLRNKSDQTMSRGDRMGLK